MEALREQSSSLLKVDIFDVSTHNRRAIIPPRFDSFEALQTISIEDTTLLPLPNFSFCHLPALLHLKVSNVLLGDQGFPPSVFNDVPRLETLRLSRVGFTEIPAALTHLRTLKRLDLSDNEIENVEARVLSTLRGLQVLDLQGNRIEVLDGAVAATLENMTSLQAFRLDGDNPFLCTCELLPFLVWLHKSSIHIGKKSNFATYACKNPSQLSGARLLSPDLLSYLESNCSRDVTDEPSASPPNTTEESHGGKVADVSLSYQIIIPVAIVSVVLSAVGVVATWMLHKRLKRRWVGLFRRFDPNIVPRQVSNTPDQEMGYRYDAYICHHESATEFVVNEMMPEMEGEPGGFRLCLSFRDFLVGADKVDNVATAMKASRFVIVLLDGEFIACGQCMLELNMACTRTLEAGVCVVPAAPSSEAHHLLPDGATGLLLVLLEALPVEALPTTLRVLQDKITCLEWNREDTRRCWQQLKISLRNTTYYQSPQLERVLI
ncbi:toll-like receptor 2 type-2 [Acanthaster planci]|uniref:Toll-like receptor 2 type-2 n=1 Tax=Acanthaster planci TaxID=133434 RepID=A0A8B7XJL0_ACAPL|nr:toll-like receptor 2 type-2 [Acanthaster planci]